MTAKISDFSTDLVNNHLSVTLYSEEHLLKLGKNRKEQKYFGIYTKNRSE